MLRRRLATCALLLPLSVNGMWMVCVDPPSAVAGAPSDAAASECDQICVRSQIGDQGTTGITMSAGEEQAPSGEICLLPANGGGSWDGIAAFAMAMPVASVTLTLSSVVEPAPARPPALYLSPPLARSTPPPEA